MSSRKALPSQEFLQECFEYSLFTGSLWWKHRPRNHFSSDRYYRTWNSRLPGKRAGSLDSYGHLTIRVNDTLYFTHRIIFKLVTGFDPQNTLDHWNGFPSDNRLINLREATQRQNTCNRGAQSNSSTGIKGVRVFKRIGKYAASIGHKGKVFHLGYFTNTQDAHAAYCQAASELHGAFYNPGHRKANA